MGMMSWPVFTLDATQPEGRDVNLGIDTSRSVAGDDRVDMMVATSIAPKEALLHVLVVKFQRISVLLRGACSQSRTTPTLAGVSKINKLRCPSALLEPLWGDVCLF
jgi:hypothetical protein